MERFSKISSVILFLALSMEVSGHGLPAVEYIGKHLEMPVSKMYSSVSTHSISELWRLIGWSHEYPDEIAEKQWCVMFMLENSDLFSGDSKNSCLDVFQQSQRRVCFFTSGQGGKMEVHPNLVVRPPNPRSILDTHEIYFWFESSTWRTPVPVLVPLMSTFDGKPLLMESLAKELPSLRRNPENRDEVQGMVLKLEDKTDSAPEKFAVQDRVSPFFDEKQLVDEINSSLKQALPIISHFYDVLDGVWNRQVLLLEKEEVQEKYCETLTVHDSLTTNNCKFPDIFVFDDITLWNDSNTRSATWLEYAPNMWFFCPKIKRQKSPNQFYSTAVKGVSYDIDSRTPLEVVLRFSSNGNDLHHLSFPVKKDILGNTRIVFDEIRLDGIRFTSIALP